MLGGIDSSGRLQDTGCSATQQTVSGTKHHMLQRVGSVKPVFRRWLRIVSRCERAFHPGIFGVLTLLGRLVFAGVGSPCSFGHVAGSVSHNLHSGKVRMAAKTWPVARGHTDHASETLIRGCRPCATASREAKGHDRDNHGHMPCSFDNVHGNTRQQIQA